MHQIVLQSTKAVLNYYYSAARERRSCHRQRRYGYYLSVKTTMKPELLERVYLRFNYRDICTYWVDICSGILLTTRDTHEALETPNLQR